MIAAAVGILLRCLRALPPGVAWWLGGVLGHAFGGLPMRDQRRAREHLRQAFPGRDAAWIAATARRAFRHIGRMALWTLATRHWSPERLRRGIAVEGADNVRALARGLRRRQGAFLFTGHFGNWELLVRVFACLGPSAVIARRLRSPLADRLVGELRARGGSRVIHQDEDPREVLRALRSGYQVGTLVDQDIPSLAGVFVPWFGRPAHTPSGPAAFALLARVPTMSLYLYRRGGRWVLHAGPLVPCSRSGDRDADIAHLTAWHTAYLEALVRRQPEQWVWWHKRWRTRPSRGTAAVAAPGVAPGSRS